MNGRRATAACCLAWLLLPAPAAAAGPSFSDPDELSAELAELEQAGVVLDPSDLAALETAGPEPTDAVEGTWSTALDRSAAGRLRLDTRLLLSGGRWRLGARWRRDAADDRGQTILWGTATAGRLALTGGAGQPAHGSGLLTAPVGARSSLAVDSSLLPARPGWRSSLAATVPERLQGLTLSWNAERLVLETGAAVDAAGRRAAHVRLGLQDAAGTTRVALLGLRRAAARAAGCDLRWDRGPWRLALEAGAWRVAAQPAVQKAWTLTAGWRSRRWRAEFQTASAQAAGGLPGARRPASLPGWLGGGRAWRLLGRPVDGLRLGVAGSEGEDRDPRTATGKLRRRTTRSAMVAGRLAGGLAWEMRWRRLEEATRAWSAWQPWLPAREERRRLRTWWSLQGERETPSGTVRLSWRRLEEEGRARDLLSLRWQDGGDGLRWRVGWQTAWGDPLDLVTVTAPLSSLIRIRHWGSWDSSLYGGLESRGRWRWQVGGEVRRRSRSAGGGLMGEARMLWGLVF